MTKCHTLVIWSPRGIGCLQRMCRIDGAQRELYHRKRVPLAHAI